MANPSHHNKDFSNKEGSHLPPELPQNIIAAAKEILDISRLNLSWDFMEVIPAPVFVKDLEHRYIACNRQFLDILSCKGYGSVLGKTTGELIGKTNAEDHFTSDRQVILSGNEITYESSFPGDTEKVRIALITKSPLKLSDGSISAIAGIITDISRLKALQVQQAFHNSQLEIQVARRTEELEQKNSRLLSEIAEKVSIQQEMLRFENRLEVALKALKAGAWELEPHSGKLEWSSKCYEIFDIEPGPVSPEKWMGKVHPEDIDRVKTQWSRISARMGWFELDFRIMAYGKPHWIRKSGYYLPGSHENGERITGVMADISEEKYFNDRLLDSQRFFKAIVEDQTELICRIRPDGSFTFVNQAFARFFGKPVPTLLTLTLREIIIPKDYAKIRRLLNLVKPVSTVVNFDHQLEKPGSGPAMMQWTIRAIYTEGDILSEYQFVGRDVTEVESSREALRRSEEMFRLIAENSNDIISIHPHDGTVEYVSPSVKNILGYTAEEITGSKAGTLIYEKDLPDISTLGKRLKKCPNPVLAAFRIKDHEGKLIWFESMIQPQYNSHGEATGKIIAVTRDISARKQAEAQQKLVEKQLKEANFAKDKFFSIIAHDLRSPFTSILGFSRLLNEEYDDFSDEDRKTMVQQILISTEHTFQLLDNLLAWAKTQMGHTCVYPEIFRLEGLINETVQLASAQAESKNISIKQLSNHQFEVKADVNMTKTVMRNLLSNAIKYSYEGAQIVVDSKREGDMVRITVTDHGTGIHADTLRILFSLDEKVISAKGTANEKGTGLGLILVREFVERNGGTISVESEYGKGSRFSFTLPLNPDKYPPSAHDPS